MLGHFRPGVRLEVRARKGGFVELGAGLGVRVRAVWVMAGAKRARAMASA